MTRQIKFWLFITLIHVGVIYVYSRTLVASIVVATVVTSDQFADQDGVKSPTDMERATDAQTSEVQKSNESTKDAKTISQVNGLKISGQKASVLSANLAQKKATESKSADNANAEKLVAATHLGGYLHNPKPPYPSLSKQADEQGTVTLEVMVEANGLPSSVVVSKSSGYSRLDRSARDTVLNQYQFIPARQGGAPIRYRYNFDVNFSLQKS